ncbi:putative Fe2OG dioxygenase domain-containing protein [Phytophthora infestans]|uniref:Putative Fe2OG dioxygenase domain-containing protein n=1 Tax=Phytophthora infestans TaxID=4787 RepID=A0A833SH72_PHYIN|nr:putative Fe2OG dioxygenase domain-containing protein [Phytophthora infestans]
MRHLQKHDNPLVEALAFAIIFKMDDEEFPFGLFLDHEYTEKSLRKMGSGALKGVGSARVHALVAANGVVAADKKLEVFIAQLQHDITYMDDGDSFEKKDSSDSIT